MSISSSRLEGREMPISVHADFPGGNIEVVAIDQTTHTLQLRPAYHPARGWPAWWYARLDGLPVGKEITFSIRANPAPYMPSRILAPEWCQPECAVFSRDNQTWVRTSAGKQEKLVRTYKFTATAKQMWIAWGPPFMVTHAERLIDDILVKVPGATRFTVAKTLGGREVNGAKLGSGPASIWIQARQHAWEAGSSWTAKGLIDWISGNHPEAVELRKRATIYFVPIVDVDNVTLGAGGKEAIPQDHNRDWTERPHYPEVAAIQQRLLALDKAGSLLFFLDLHNPQGRDRQPFFYGLFPEQLDSDKRREVQTRWLEHAKKQMTGPLVLEPEYRVADYQKKAGEHLRTSRTWVWAHSRASAVAATVEIPWNTPSSTVEGYEKVGAQLAAAISNYLADPATLASGENVANFDESKIGPITLPDPLVSNKGVPVTDVAAWMKQRRPEILEWFRAHVYGRSPEKPSSLKFELAKLDPSALGGLATRKEISVCLTDPLDGPKMTILLYLPNHAKKPTPSFLGLNFMGNHTVSNDPGISLATGWMRENKKNSVVDHRASDKDRGAQASRWQIEKVLKRGYATATIYYGDIEPDHVEGWKMGVRAASSKDGSHTQWKPDDWGAIGAWAWGLSRALDYLETDKDIDAKRIAVHGHSRLGKAALWAGATDERFAIIISNNSGEGGAALTRRDFGETTAIITKLFPHWFCGRYASYSHNANALPIDQHMLLALAAPRPLYVASAQDDTWADPRGEFLSAKNAEPVYALFKKTTLGVSEMPAVNQPVGESIGYHIRTGKHDITEYDWEQYLNFADKHFGPNPPR